MSSDAADDFMMMVVGYFGQYRGKAARDEIRDWIRSKTIPARLLKAAYRELKETHDIEPTNTIGITDIRRALERVAAKRPATKELPDPTAKHDPEVEQGLKELTAKLVRKTRIERPDSEGRRRETKRQAEEIGRTESYE